MELPGNFSSLKEEMNLQNQGSWVAVTPVKPVPSKMPVVTGGESWLEKAGISSAAVAGGSCYNLGGNAAENGRQGNNGSSSFCFDSTRTLSHNWEEAMTAATSGWNLNQQNYRNFRNCTDLTSAAGVSQRGENWCYPYQVISYPQTHARQPVIHARQPVIHAPQPATLSLQSKKILLGGMFPCNATTYSPQITPHGFPVPYNPSYDHSPMSQLVSNAIPREAISYQFSPVTQEKIIRVQNNQSLSMFTDFCMNERGKQEKMQGSPLQSIGSLLHVGPVTSEKMARNERTQSNLSASKLIHFGIEEMINQEKNHDGSLHSWGSPLQFAPVTPEKNAQNERAQNNRSPSTLIEFGIDERANQEKNQGCPIQSKVSPGNKAIEICCHQGLSQSLAIHPSHFAPATPGKNVQNNQSPSALIDFVDGRTNHEKSQGCSLPCRVSPENEAIEIHGDQVLSQSLAIHSCQLDEIPEVARDGVHVIDLNKTPQQKPKRKKHRPKVIREKKSTKSPKPVTPKQAGTEENATRKRSIGKQGHKDLATPLTCEIESSAVRASRVHIPLCKRSLNFESVTQARDGGLGTSDMHHNKLDSREDGSKAENSHIIAGLEVKGQSAGITFDLNCSASQMLDSYPPLPEKQILPSPLKRKTTSRENIKSMARKRSNMGITTVPVDNGNATTYNYITSKEMRPESLIITPNHENDELLQKAPGSITESHLDSNISTQPQVAHAKPGVKELNQGYGHTAYNTIFHPINLNEGNLIQMRTHSDMIHGYQYPSNHNQQSCQINRKEITEKPKNGANKAVLDISSFSMPVTQTHMAQTFPREDQTGIAFHKAQGYETMLAFSQTELKMKRSKAATRIRNMATFSSSRCNQMLVIHPNRTPVYDAKQEHGFSHRPQHCMEAPVANKQAKMVTKKRTKKVSHTVNSPVFSPTNQVHQQKDGIIIYDDRQSIIESTIARLGQKSIQSNASSPRKLQTPDLHILPMNSTHDCRSSSSLHGTIATVPPVDPIDEISQRLKDLNINRGNETATTQIENALVPYVGDGIMVPYEGPFDPMKKRRSRPKVDLDMETVRQWKLLMGKDSSESLEGTDEQKEKWWEEERRVFRGRADSFIARMHLVQGDRRFSQWKGSVVDSVVGVFLTQNVSDHLSSSAFMSLAARFPLKTNNGAPNTDETNIAPPEPDVCTLEFDNKTKWQDKLMMTQMPDQSSMTHHEAQQKREIMTNSRESFGSNTLGHKANCSEGTHSDICETGQKIYQKSTENRKKIPVTATVSGNLAEFEDGRSPEDVSLSVVSSQNSTDSIAQIADRIGSSSESNYEVEELIPRCSRSYFDSSTFTELLHMTGTQDFQKFYMNETASLSSEGDFGSSSDQLQTKEREQRKLSLERLKSSCSSLYPANSHAIHTQYERSEDAGFSFVNHNVQPIPGADSVELAFPAPGGTTESVLPSNASYITEVQDNCKSEKNDKILNDPAREMTKALFGNKTLHVCSELPVEDTIHLQSKAGEASFCTKSKHVAGNGICVEALAQKGQFIMQKTNSSLANYEGETSNNVGCSRLTDILSPMGTKILESSSRDEACSAEKTSVVKTNDALKAKKGRGLGENKKAFDWDSLRKQVNENCAPKERSNDTMDSLDWEAVRCAEVNDIAETIRERGMNNMLAERIKDFLNRLVRDHGSLDLEWLRDIQPDKAKDYLLSVRGLGLKSVECVRLLSLQHLAFPVDTNVGRICVRLGWVPLQPLPESLQLHLLELYPVLESIQKYLWPRLCKLDQRTLYELHYQLITFGKVFCTKSRPNCNACPMRGECKHFASAFASARLALPGPEEKGLISSVAPIMTEPDHKEVISPKLLAPPPPPEANFHLQAYSGIDKCEPIIEEPATPDYVHSSESAIEGIEIEDTPYAIEDAPGEDPDEIPTIKLNLEELTLHVQNYIQENKMELQGDMSKALVALNPEAASIPTPKLKNVNRLRTEHQVYELPDTHPLLKGLDPREPDDPCSYLLAIWTPGETAESIEPPEMGCNYQASGDLCDKETCFACNSIREANAQTVRGTLLIPCRTAMRGTFPLNGTYFQVNEVFADHDSSLTPIDVPRAWIWNLPRRTVFFGTSIPTIFRGLTTEGIQYCFWRGFVCVRGFERKKRAPRPLLARLHFPASKLTRPKKGSAREEE